jgi:hypothetical protein
MGVLMREMKKNNKLRCLWGKCINKRNGGVNVKIGENMKG